MMLVTSTAVARDGGPPLEIVTFNVWHGLRTEGVWRFPGEDPARREARIAFQIDTFRELAADVFFFQEVNPTPRLARRYAAELAYDEVHKVDSCGLRLGPLGIPSNMKAGLAILARPELRLRRLGVERLSGPGVCCDHAGFQVAESRYALFAEITVAGDKVLLVNTHLHNAPFGHAGFAERIETLADEGRIESSEAAEILDRHARHFARQQKEVAALLRRLERYRRRDGYTRVILAGDFNAEPASPVVERLEAAGLARVTDTGEELPTADPVVNHESNRIGSKTKPPYPSFDNPALTELYAEESSRRRRIDHLFVTGGWRVVAAHRVLDEPRDGLFASDHFGVAARLLAGGGP